MGVGHGEISKVLQEQVDQEQRASQAALCHALRRNIKNIDTWRRSDLDAALVCKGGAVLFRDCYQG